MIIKLNKTRVEKLLGRKGFLTAKEVHIFWSKLLLDLKKKADQHKTDQHIKTNLKTL